MKKFITLFYITMMVVSAMAQPDYPSVPQPVPNLVQLEYFFDTDPGAGNGRIVTLTASQHINAFSFNADLTGLANGFHRIYLRSMDADGKWSHTHNSYFDNVIVPAYAVAPMPAGHIMEVEYFIDNDPGAGNGNKLVVTPGPDVSNQSIAVSISGLSTGVHRLYIRSKDADGKWSLTHFGLFDNSASTPYPAAPVPAPPIDEMEYYIDTDPGFGNATPIVFTAGTDISNFSIDIPLNSISQGTHTLYIRSKQNPWSHSAYAQFLIGSILPVSWLYVKGQMNDAKAIISWATAQEENTSEFIIEHSMTGNDFAAAGSVAAAGSSSSSKPYSFVHAAPGHGFNYYRIKQVDKDGQFSYSKIITLLNTDRKSTTIIGPNPVMDVLHIIEPHQVFIKKLEIYDMTGRMMIQKNIDAENRVFNISTASLLKGSYVIKIAYKNSFRTFAVIKE